MLVAYEYAEWVKLRSSATTTGLFLHALMVWPSILLIIL